MATLYILLVLPALVLARIDVELSGQFDGDHSDLKVLFSGNQVGVITDSERNTFQLSDNNLKNAIRSYFGKRPDDAYVRSPTPWGDLYQSYGWDQVQRTLAPKSGKVLGISSQPTIVLQQVFENNSSKPATFEVGISQSVQNTVTSSWSKGGELSIGQDINYGFDFEVINGGGTTSFSYTSSWGQNTEKSESITIGASTGMQILLQPGQAVIVQLHATRGTIKLEVEYEASLSGTTAVNYGDVYRGHHFWGMDIKSVMSSGGLSNQKISREVIEIGFYSKAKVTVHDQALNALLLNVNF